MTSAALQAEALGRRLERIGNTARLPHAVAKAAAAVVANLWRIATGADFIHPRTRGAKAAGTDVFDRHLAKVIAAADDPAVNLALSRVQQMLAPPPVLFTPAIMRRALVSSRRHRRDVRTAGGAGHGPPRPDVRRGVEDRDGEDGVVAGAAAARGRRWRCLVASGRAASWPTPARNWSAAKRARTRSGVNAAAAGVAWTRVVACAGGPGSA